jgi:phosphatidate cytidylyltransferase
MAPAMVESRLAALPLRLISGLVLAPVAIAAIILGSLPFALLVAAGVVALAWEWDRLCGGEGFGASGVALALPLLAAIAFAGRDQMQISLLLVAFAAALGLAIGWFEGAGGALWRGLGALYVGLPAVALLWLRDQSGWRTLLWVFLVVWATDIGAYAAGRLVGGPKLWPSVSPNKTWAGVAGGLLAALAVAAAAAEIFGDRSPGPAAALSLLLALVAILGDLAESALKRHFRVKDMSALIPGHGGLFDRVDGLLAVGPVMALIMLVMRGGVLAWR